VTAIGCGDDGGGADPCDADVAAICAAACACDDQSGPDDDAFCAIGDASGDVSFSGQAECESFIDACDEMAGAFEDCADTLDDGTCNETDPDDPVYVLPTACEPII